LESVDPTSLARTAHMTTVNGRRSEYANGRGRRNQDGVGTTTN
jgi:hypothetical protein